MKIPAYRGNLLKRKKKSSETLSFLFKNQTLLLAILFLQWKSNF